MVSLLHSFVYKSYFIEFDLIVLVLNLVIGDLDYNRGFMLMKMKGDISFEYCLFIVSCTVALLFIFM